MLVAVADTHAIVWYLYQDPRISPHARDVFEHAADNGDQIGFSSITLAELVYLMEKGRIQPEVIDRLLSALDHQDSLLLDLPFDRLIALSLRDIDREQVPDLPDRIIAATAAARGVPLITRDQRISASTVPTIW